MQTKAQQFAAQLEAQYGTPLDCTAVQEIGFRKTTNGKLVLLYDWIEVPGNPDEKPDFEQCPKCGAMLIERQGKWGAFVGCTAFPKCTYTKNV